MEAMLEIRTLYFSVCATLFTLSACMVNYLYSRKIFPGFRSWTLASFLSALAVLLLGLRHFLPDFISIISSNTLAIIAMFFFYNGFKSFAGEKLNLQLHLVFIIVYSIVLFPTLTYLTPNLRARIIIASIASGGYFLLCGLVHYRQVQQGFLKLNKLLMTTILLLVALRAFRAVYYFIPSNNISDLISSGGVAGVFILMLSMLSASFLIGLMQLNSQRLEEDNIKQNMLLRERGAELEKALSEIKTLQGILPICSNCKSIRDDKGYWQKLEKFLEERSAAEFSHSICPECAKKLYPDLDIYDD
jgi:hypothetical protein